MPWKRNFICISIRSYMRHGGKQLWIQYLLALIPKWNNNSQSNLNYHHILVLFMRQTLFHKSHGRKEELIQFMWHRLRAGRWLRVHRRLGLGIWCSLYELGSRWPPLRMHHSGTSRSGIRWELLHCCYNIYMVTLYICFWIYFISSS